jgi:hypothetical protein
MLKHGPSLSQHQLETMKAWYIQPYLQIIADAVEDKGAAVLKNLVAIATSSITNTQKNLVIGEGVAQPDEDLKVAISKIMGELPKEQFDYLYDALYILIHQFRLNKNPDSPFADEHNALMIAQHQIGGGLYENTYHKKGTISHKLKDKDIEPNSAKIESAFITVIKNVLEEILSQSVQKEIVPNNNFDDSKKRKRVAKTQEEVHSVIDLTLDETPNFLPQYKNNQEQEELDRQLALKMTKEEELTLKKPKLSPDEILARKLQEEEDLAYARYLSSSPNRV